MKVSIGDISLFVDIEGPGLLPDGPSMRERPTLLLLHGGPGADHATLRPAFAAMADVCQVVYYDHRGNGRSDRGDPSTWNLAQWADDVVALCNALGIKKPIVLGQSFGGMVAMAYATRHPAHPAKLILSSTTAKTRLDRVALWMEKHGGVEARDICTTFWRDPTLETFEAYRTTCLPLYNRASADGHFLQRTTWNLECLFHFIRTEDKTFNFLPDLHKVQCPTLVVTGADDPITPEDDARDIVSALPQALTQYESFPGCRHGVFREEPDAYFRLLRTFVTTYAGAIT